MKSATMITWDLDPFRTRGGTAYAIRRLADQLTNLGIETGVLLPDGSDTHVVNYGSPLLKPMFLKLPADIDRASRGIQCREFCSIALDVLAQTDESDVVIAHSLEGAMSIVMRSVKRSTSPSVFWLHSLYDPPLDEFSKEGLPLRTLLASGVATADVVVTSSGILKDACEFIWPEPLRDLQSALTVASREARVVTVESTGCLPNRSQKRDQNPNLTKLKPYVLFPGRPSVDKGLGIFAAIAERLRADNITCVAVKRPIQAESENPNLSAPINWLSWLTQDELVVAIQNAACTVLPSITEGFGLAAAESIDLGVTTLFHEVGGHHALSRLPNAVPVSLTSAERSLLYGLWSELFGSEDYWAVWASYEKLLEPLIERWVEAIRSVVFGGVFRNSESVEWPIEEQWGSRLVRVIDEGRSPMLEGSAFDEAQPRVGSKGVAQY